MALEWRETAGNLVFILFAKLSEIATPSEIASVLQSDEGRQALEYFLNNFADHGIFNDGNYSCKQ